MKDREISSYTARRKNAISVKKCGRTFSETKGTAFYRLRTDADHVSNMVSLMKHGCPPQAIVATYGHDERTVYDWYARGSNHCRCVHEDIVEQHQIDIKHLQADELCIRTVKPHKDKEDHTNSEKDIQKDGASPQSEDLEMQTAEDANGSDHSQENDNDVLSGETENDFKHMWMAMAMDVETRLWLGGVVGVNRNKDLILTLAQKVRACAKNWNILLCVDGLSSYVSAFMFVFSMLVYTGRPGRPKRETSSGLMIAQVIKEYSKGRVTNVVQRIVRGSAEAVESVLRKTGSAKINTSYIERLNATFRGRLATLVRKGRAIAHRRLLLEQGMYLTGCSYNFCYFHSSLRVATPEGSSRKWIEMTPAMASGLTDHRWMMKELLGYKIRPKPKTFLNHG